jgi:hypothetical protein
MQRLVYLQGANLNWVAITFFVVKLAWKFQVIKKVGCNLNPIIFADYLINIYICFHMIWGPVVNCASVAVDTCLTTNACESFHAHFNSNINSTHSNIFVVIAKLKEVLTETYIKINSLDVPFQFQNTKTKKKKKENS